MAAFNKFQALAEALPEKVHNLQSDTLRIMLSNTAPAATNAVKADITEIAAGNGYAAGGPQATVSSSAQTALASPVKRKSPGLPSRSQSQC